MNPTLRRLLIVSLLPIFAAMAYAEQMSITTIALDRAVHFNAPDGGDVQLGPGSYRVEPGSESQLRLTTEGGQPIQIAAAKSSHNETLFAPIAMGVIEEGQDDTMHLVLMLPNGQALDATGSYSGVQPRALLSSALKPVQIQSAVNQVKVSPTPVPAQPMPQQVVPASAIIRVPQASVGSVITQSVLGTWITWNYLAMQHPEVVAQTFADVQAGKKPPSVLTGYASPSELNDLMKMNWSAEAGRLNTATLMMNQPGIVSRGVPAKPLTAAAIGSIPVSLPTKNLGMVWANEPALTVVTITSPADTYVEARFDLNATNRHFRIVKATSYTGRVVNGTLEVAQVIQGGQYQDVVVDPANAPNQISKAGFISIAARQGQRIDFTIAFEPVALGMTPVGDNQAVLTISGLTSSTIDIHSGAGPSKWTRTATIRAQFAGINFGAILYTDQQHAATLTGQTVDMPMFIRNASSAPISGAIGIVQAPGGVTLSPSSIPISIGPQTTQRLILHFKVAGTAQTGSVQPVVVQLNYANQARPLTLDMSIYEPWVWWDFGGYAVTGVDAVGNKTYKYIGIPGIPDDRTNQSGGTGITTIRAWLKNNGDFWWRIATYNQKDVDIGGSNFDVFARWKATGSTDKIAVHIGPKTNPQYYESLKNFAPLATSFIAAVEQGLTFSLVDR